MAKPLQLLEITVRPDWRELTQQAVVQRLRIWRAVQIAVAGGTLALALGRLAFPSWPWYDLLYLALFGSLFWILPLWKVLRGQQSIAAALDRAGVAYLLLLAAILLAYVTRPDLSAPPAGGVPASLVPLLLALAIPALTWPILRRIRRAFPLPAAGLGLVGERWASNLLIGALAGCALGLHLLLTASLIPGLAPPARPPLAALVWVLCYQAGLMGLGQELLLRGLAYEALFSDGSGSFAAVVGKITLLNLLALLALALAIDATLLATLWLLAYGGLLAAVATVLRHRQRSLLPGIAAVVVFNLFAWPLFAL